MTKKQPTNGLALFQNSLIVVIATGFVRASSNPKTGKMIQIWILRKDINPIESNKTGKDSAICGRCELRGTIKRVENRKVLVNRTCYVQLHQAPLAIWKAFKRGLYPDLANDYSVFMGRSVRFGAYGDPAFIPFTIVKSICDVASSWTGYTHQWQQSVFSAFKGYFMASANNAGEQLNAVNQGWRTFRVKLNHEAILPGEIACVNETNGTQCIRCNLCKGSSIRARSIVIGAHGTGAGNLATI